MAMRKAGTRRIVVDGVEYVWKFPRTRDHRDNDALGGCYALVCRPDRRGSVLHVTFPHHHPGAAPQLFPAVPVVPSQVAAAIRRAVAAGWRVDDPEAPFWVSGVALDSEPSAAPDQARDIGSGSS